MIRRHWGRAPLANPRVALIGRAADRLEPIVTASGPASIDHVRSTRELEALARYAPDVAVIGDDLEDATALMSLVWADLQWRGTPFVVLNLGRPWLPRSEQRVLGMLTQAGNSKEIAQHTALRPNTIDKTVSRLDRRLGVRSRMAMLALAYDIGLLAGPKGLRREP